MVAAVKFEIKKIFNNNVILAVNLKSDQESIFIGKGIGFSRQQGDLIAKDKFEFEKEFSPVQGEKRDNYFQLLAEVDSEIIAITEEIITMVSAELGEELDQHIRIGLADHIAFSLKRFKEGIEVANPFLAETRTLYSQEYKLAAQAVEMLEKHFKLSIPESEVGFITLHIHGARNQHGVSKTLKNTTLIKKLVMEVEKNLGSQLSYDSLNYARLVNHLRFALERIEGQSDNPNPLLENIKESFAFSFHLAEKLAVIIETEFNCQVPEAEKGYLALHLHRLKRDLKV